MTLSVWEKRTSLEKLNCETNYYLDINCHSTFDLSSLKWNQTILIAVYTAAVYWLTCVLFKLFFLIYVVLCFCGWCFYYCIKFR